MRETEFSVRLFEMGVKLVAKKTKMLGSNSAFIKRHMPSLRDGVGSGLRVIPAKDILLVQMIALMGKAPRKQFPRNWFYYVPFFSKLQKYYILENKKTGVRLFGTFDSNKNGGDK